MQKKNISNLRELTELSRLLKKSPRSPLQTNQLFESDCEILKLNQGYLCVSTDSIGEEIDLSLYRDPETWGWMTVMSSVSDLAVTGSKPLGILLANQWKYKTSEQTKKKFFKGVRHALTASGIPLLGGDSGNGESHCHTSTILGISKTKPLTRLGIRPGDFICLIGKKQLGIGPSIALGILFNLTGTISFEKKFRPQPAVNSMQKIRKYLRASIDTSDGLASSLQILSELNQVGFELQWQGSLIHPKALMFCKKNKIHPAMLWINDLGDLQSLVVVSPRNLEKVLKIEPQTVVIGKAVKNMKTLSLQMGDSSFSLPSAKVTSAKRSLPALKKVMRELNRSLVEKNGSFF